MKLSIKRRERLNQYWEMLQHNYDSRTFYHQNEIESICKTIEQIEKDGKYLVKHKETLNKLEKVFHIVNELKKVH
jgi:hypothetical protein